jgi:putative DNA primase/helicase
MHEIAVDLRHGQMRTSNPLDYITKTVACDPAPPGTRVPLWEKFLADITNSDQELQRYLRRVAGYCLTGFVTAHVMFFLYGTGANGKSVFVNTLLGLWGDYGSTVNTDMLMVSHNDRHPTEIARLRGIRLAVGSEIEVGRTWAESKVKSLTGVTGSRAGSCARTSSSSTRSSS